MKVGTYWKFSVAGNRIYSCQFRKWLKGLLLCRLLEGPENQCPKATLKDDIPQLHHHRYRHLAALITPTGDADTRAPASSALVPLPSTTALTRKLILPGTCFLMVSSSTLQSRTDASDCRNKVTCLHPGCRAGWNSEFWFCIEKADSESISFLSIEEAFERYCVATNINRSLREIIMQPNLWEAARGQCLTLSAFQGDLTGS